MNRKPGRMARGVTLIELMVAMSLTGTVLIAVSGVFLGIQKQWAYSSSRGRAVESAQMALDQICSDVRSGIAFQAIDGARTNTFSLPNSTDSAGNYLPTRVLTALQYVAGSRIRYYLSDATGTTSAGTILWRETNSSPTGDLSWTADSAWSLATGAGSITKYNNITALAFSTSGMPANVVLITVTAQVTEGTQVFTLALQRSVILANHN